MATLILITLCAIPLVISCIVRNGCARFVLSVWVGVPVLWGRMLYVETHVPDGDLDFIFFVALVVWGCVLAVVYALWFIGLELVRAVLEFWKHHD